MDENNIYNIPEPAAEPEQMESVADEAEVYEAEVAPVEEYIPEAEPGDMVEEKPRKKPKIFLWVMLIVFLAALLFAGAFFTARYLTNRVIIKNEIQSVPGGSITFSAENPAADAVKSALMSAVNIESDSMRSGFYGYGLNRESGTGAIIREDGYIITSISLAEDGGDITVTLQDGKRYTAEVDSVDRVNGIALLKIEAAGLSSIKIGDSSAVAVGDRVAVIGNRLHGNLTNPITLGYICGVDNGVGLENGRYINLFQVDASAIAESVGGLLLNAEGELIGISNGIISNASTEIGLVSPINDLAGLIGGITTVTPGSGVSELKIGFSGTDEGYGVAVTTVGEGTPAEAAGLKVGDLVVKVDGEAVTSVAKVNEIKARHVKGDTIILTVYREGEMLDINVIL